MSVYDAEVLGFYLRLEPIEVLRLFMKKCIRCDAVVTNDWNCTSCLNKVDTAHGSFILSPEFSVDEHGYDADAYKIYSELEKGHFWFEARIALIKKLMARHFPDAREFLEVGCGTGYVLSEIENAFPDLSVAGSELLVEGLDVARQRTRNATYYQLDARKMPFESEFDVIGAFDVLEHISEDSSVLSTMYQAVKPGGGIIVTVPQHSFLWSEADNYAMHKRRYNRKELVKKVEDAGFDVAMVSSFCFVSFSTNVYFKIDTKKIFVTLRSKW